MGATGAAKRRHDGRSAPWSVVGLTVVFVVVAQVQFAIAVAESVLWPAVVGVLLLGAAVAFVKAARRLRLDDSDMYEAPPEVAKPLPAEYEAHVDADGSLARAVGEVVHASRRWRA
ncbi:hypothetical protein [Lentzea sp.]|uniref:hypothetical protein n=1 Tax=Lentzea sp. TaxID=56099 RepID=UPI002C24C4C8|nr:hypothetical protein [Lentzea sp.]HUQ58859.1 hypothetical protein [Lentzea sp.]